MFDLPSWRNNFNLSDISSGIKSSALVWIKKMLSLFAAFWHGYLLGISPFKGLPIFLIILCPNQKNCLFNPEETLALAFDGVRRVGDHNFVSQVENDEGELCTHET